MRFERGDELVVRWGQDVVLAYAYKATIAGEHDRLEVLLDGEISPVTIKRKQVLVHRGEVL